MSHNQLGEVIVNADFFITETAKAFEEMVNLSGEPITPENVQKFNQAKDRFWVNANRARKEHATL